MDDLLDLDWSTSSSQQQQTSSSTFTANKQLTSQQKQPKDAFADLLNFSSSTPPPPPPSSLNQQRLQQQQQTVFQPSPMSGLSPTNSTTTSNTSSPRLTHDISHRTATPPLPTSALQQQPLAPSPLIPSQSSSPSSSNTATQNPTSLEELLDPFAKSKSKSSGNVPLNTLRTQQTTGTMQEFGGNGPHSPWNFDLLSPGSANSVPTAAATVPTISPSTGTNQDSHIPLDPFDMDSLIQVTQTSQQPSATAIHGNDDDDDINPLGLLAEPVSKISSQEEMAFIPNDHAIKDDEEEFTRRSSVSSNHTPSPTNYSQQHQQHDALLAQLVDMGFGVEESQVALEASGNVDLQSAIDLIVQQTEAMRQKNESAPEPTKTPREANHGDDGQEPSFQQHKERLVSQASELGGYFYKNASLFVKSGKQKIAKAVEDYREQQTQQQQQQRQGRPKWMTADAGQVDGNEQDSNSTLEKFVDSDDDNDMGPLGNGDDEEQQMMERMEQERRHVEALRQKQQKEQQKQRQQKPVFRSRLLDDDDDEDHYVSPSRRRQQQSPRPSSSTTKPSTAVPQRHPSPPPPPPSRPVVEASSDQLSLATTHRQKGNELYKLGQFGDAEAAYTKAIDILPAGHYHLILLSNNRAMARLKTGHYKQCIEDCDVAFDMAAYVAGLAAGNVTSQDAIIINGRDHTIKALHRKSEALEHLEKYELALASYQELIKWEGTGNGKVNQALARCRKIVQGPPPPSSQAAPPKRKTTTTSATVSGNGKAVSAMRAQAAQQEADDAERLAKTDYVNDQLAKWKQGKEANLRALLATLDTLLWPEANWKPIQISELIQPKKCKINYLKAIGKVHPDKLSSTVTVEQRMIASGIFSTLNEAWDSFKTENNL
ncbi:hypothetical protein BCR42DRAFT_364726 [Absidia repens]|uniref:UBA domain-containing protein n=1 Tax=Absidia repens TaxID=90262 RepID=A0A1X2J2N1_9FUNG|nr:hypothetical protein BCR42DRAFT_364726 [Absidia repens]